MDYEKDNMISEEMRTSSDSEEEVIASAIDDDDDDGVRYSLRSRTIPKSGVTRMKMTREDSPTWIEYQRRHADELDEGRRAIERIAAGAAYTSDEPYIYTGPRSLLVGRHDQHAVRLGKQTRKCDNASQAGTSHGATGQVLNVAGQRSDEFHSLDGA